MCVWIEVRRFARSFLKYYSSVRLDPLTPPHSWVKCRDGHPSKNDAGQYRLEFLAAVPSDPPGQHAGTSQAGLADSRASGPRVARLPQASDSVV